MEGDGEETDSSFERSGLEEVEEFVQNLMARNSDCNPTDQSGDQNLESETFHEEVASEDGSKESDDGEDVEGLLHERPRLEEVQEFVQNQLSENTESKPVEEEADQNLEPETLQEEVVSAENSKDSEDEANIVNLPQEHSGLDDAEVFVKNLLHEPTVDEIPKEQLDQSVMVRRIQKTTPISDRRMFSWEIRSNCF